MSQHMPSPRELRVSKDRRLLSVVFSDAERYENEAELLRVMSPSAEVKGHGPGERVTVYGKRDIGIIKLEPVGNYAVRVTFDDMHDTGIFSWTYLRELGQDRDERWAAYLRELDEKGLSRDLATSKR